MFNHWDGPDELTFSSMFSWSDLTIPATAVGTLGAVWLNSHFQERANKRAMRREAYEGLITSAEVLTSRILVTLEVNTLARTVIGPSIAGTVPILATLITSWPLRISVSGWKVAKMVGEAIGNEKREPPFVSNDVFQNGLEDLQRSWLKVRIVGEEEIVNAGKRLIEAATAFFEAAAKVHPRVPWKEKLVREEVDLKRQEMEVFLDSFIALARKERKS